MSMEYPKKFPDGTIIDGIFASEAIDTSGEILDVKGCDVSDLEEGKGVFNYEHRGADSPGASPLDIVGRVLYVKKIFKKEDCDDERQLDYWDSIELPFIYGIGVLFDEDGHDGARAIAAMFRHCLKANEPPIVKYSIEGSTLEKEGNILKRSMARRIAVTLKPANRTAVSGVIEKEEVSNVELDPKDEKVDIASLAKYKTLGKHEGRYNPLFKMDPVENLRKALKLSKVITAGSTNAPPGQLVGGAALQKEDENLKRKHLHSRLLAAVRDWDKSEDLKTFIKNRLPEASDDYVDKFVDLIGYYKLKKSVEDGGKVVSDLMIDSILVTPLEKSEKAFDDAHKALVYKRLATYMGLGKHVPAYSSFFDPSGKKFQVQNKVYGRHAEIPLTDHDQESVMPLLNNGTLDKIAILDKLLDISRNVSNFIISDDKPHIFLIDNDLWFGSGFEIPDYLNCFKPKHPGLNVAIRPLHPEAMFWLEKLDDKKIADIMRKCGAPEDLINKVITGVGEMKRMVASRKDLLVQDILNYEKLGVL